MGSPRVAAVILAAGKGTRLNTELPKVLHEVCGRPMLAYVIDACREAGIVDCVCVVGYRKELVRAAFADDRRIEWVTQEPQLGTGHAAMMCREQIARYEHVVLLCGDGPLIRAETIGGLIEKHANETSAATLATAILDDPTGYGRINRDAHGRLLGIVEHDDCTVEQRAIREVNPSYYCFDATKLLWALERIRPNNVKGEYYITDCLSMLIERGDKAVAITSVPPEDVFSINTRQDLALVNRVMRDHVLTALMNSGVTIVDPTTTWIDGRARIGTDTIIYPNVYIHGAARIGAGCRVGPFAEICGSPQIADRSVITAFTRTSA